MTTSDIAYIMIPIEKFEIAAVVIYKIGLIPVPIERIFATGSRISNVSINLFTLQYTFEVPYMKDINKDSENHRKMKYIQTNWRTHLQFTSCLLNKKKLISALWLRTNRTRRKDSRK